VAEADFLHPEWCPGAIRTRPVCGSLNEPGPGQLWAAFDLEVVAGTPMSPLARAVMIGDFGNGVGSPFPDRPWSCANLDIDLNFLRMPRGEWVLIDAETLSAGEGYAVVRNTFADAEGVYGFGAQTLFIAPAG
jgi:Thioesterase-like superfamily